MTLNHVLTAYNTATRSDNKIHDDDVASKLGFTGGLVPGVEVFAYMAHVPVNHWGKAFLSGGQMRGRFLSPVYDGEKTLVEGVEDPDRLALTVSNPAGDTCAVGEARLRRADEARPKIIPSAPRIHPTQRPPASPASLPKGKHLGSLHETYMAEECGWYMKAVREPLSFYAQERICHPGFLLRRANFVLAYSVVLGPWIHVESDVAFLSPLRDGEPFTTSAIVTDNFEKGGHLFVDLDVSIVSEDRPVMAGTHRAIYEPKQLRG
ncbi:MAG: hypothetical protein ACPG06_08590 [Alphaproteobacteria bacterium]